MIDLAKLCTSQEPTLIPLYWPYDWYVDDKLSEAGIEHRLLSFDDLYKPGSPMSDEEAYAVGRELFRGLPESLWGLWPSVLVSPLDEDGFREALARLPYDDDFIDYACSVDMNEPALSREEVARKLVEMPSPEQAEIIGKLFGGKTVEDLGNMLDVEIAADEE